MSELAFDLKYLKPKEENISARFLLDTLSDEEDSSPEEFKQQKCDFFQDLLLSTLTSRGLSLNVDGNYENVYENEIILI